MKFKQYLLSGVLVSSLFFGTQASAEQIFKDVDTSNNAHYFADNVKMLSDMKIIGGYTSGENAGKFLPFNKVTRGQSAKMIVGLVNRLDIGERERPRRFFADSGTYGDVIADAYSYGIFDGYANGDFGTNNPLTRGQMAKVIAKAFGFKPTRHYNPYGDVLNTDYEPHVRALYELDITQSPNGKFNPYAPITRGQLAQLLGNAYNVKKEQVKNETKPTPPTNGGNNGGNETKPTPPTNGGNNSGNETKPTPPTNGGNNSGNETKPTPPTNGGNNSGNETKPTPPTNGGNETQKQEITINVNAYDVETGEKQIVQGYIEPVDKQQHSDWREVTGIYTKGFYVEMDGLLTLKKVSLKEGQDYHVKFKTQSSTVYTGKNNKKSVIYSNVRFEDSDNIGKTYLGGGFEYELSDKANFTFTATKGMTIDMPLQRVEGDVNMGEVARGTKTTQDVADSYGKMLNTYRAEYGLHPLENLTSLNVASDWRAYDMYKFNYFAHENPYNNMKLKDFLGIYHKNMMYTDGYYGGFLENIVSGGFSVGDYFQSFLNSPNHAWAMRQDDIYYFGVGASVNEIKKDNRVAHDSYSFVMGMAGAVDYNEIPKLMQEGMVRSGKMKYEEKYGNKSYDELHDELYKDAVY